jgi:hypothetical protein
MSDSAVHLELRFRWHEARPAVNRLVKGFRNETTFAAHIFAVTTLQRGSCLSVFFFSGRRREKTWGRGGVGLTG